MFCKVTRDDISPMLRRLAETARNPLPIYRAMGTTFKSITEGNFNSVGASYRPSPWPPKKDGSPSILQQSTTLAKSFDLEVTGTYARLSNPMVYAAIHQFGGEIRPKSGKWLRFYSNGRWWTVAKVTIPPRPFFPVTPEGKLTPAAEEKISAAGRREIERELKP